MTKEVGKEKVEIEVYERSQKEVLKDLLSKGAYEKQFTATAKSLIDVVKNLFLFTFLTLLQAVRILVKIVKFSLDGYKGKKDEKTKQKTKSK